ncbi:hypothetical protein GOBAR_DD35130 [Gossypium barbadense]|nr:hypothetical protein GOBAR_DD35130 [Gossypium barbadense]
MFTSYNNFTMSASGGSSAVYGLFQCRGDLNNRDCNRCVAKAVSQIGTLCFYSTGGVLQLERCLVKYDNVTFLGVEDKTVVVKKCGPSFSSYSDALTRRDSVLSYLEASDGTYKPFRISESGNLQGVAQCVGDLSPSECQDCLSEAIGQLKTECGAAKWGDLYLAKCYVRFSEGGYHSHAGKRYGGAKHAGIVLAEAWGVVADMVVFGASGQVGGRWLGLVGLGFLNAEFRLMGWGSWVSSLVV